MSWVTIYDIRNAWGAWIATALCLGLIAVESFLLVGSLRLIRNASDASQQRKRVLGAVGISAVYLIPIALCLWVSVRGFAMRADLNAGRVLKTEGVIESAHIESSVKSNTMYFEVGDEWFKLPYHFSPECFPHNGENAKLTYEPVATIKHNGPDAHEVLKMQLTHGCELPVWG